MGRAKKNNKRFGIETFLNFSLLRIILLSVCSVFILNLFEASVEIKEGKQDKIIDSKTTIYKDSLYKYSISFPSNYTIKKMSDHCIVIREKKDIESTIRVLINVQNFETVTSTGTLFYFNDFVRKQVTDILSPANVNSVIDTVMIKEFKNSCGLKGKENYVRIVDKAQLNSKDKESQIIKGPVYVLDISEKTGRPRTAIVFYQKTDDSKTSKLLRNVVDEIKFEN